MDSSDTTLEKQEPSAGWTEFDPKELESTQTSFTLVFPITQSVSHRGSQTDPSGCSWG
jgi:hypothetical protein